MPREKNPRPAKAVEKLIADAKQRQVDNAVMRFIKRIVASDQVRRDSNGSGTRSAGRKPKREPGQ